MKQIRLGTIWPTLFVMAMLSGCGSVVLGTVKYMANPLGLQGRSASSNTFVTVSGLTTRITADQQNALQFTLNDQTVSGNPYEGLNQVEMNQQATLVFDITSSGTLPNTIILRNVSLVATVRVSEGARTSAPIEFQYTGSLTLERQPNGSYKARENLTFAHNLDRFDGSALVTMLISGGSNTVAAAISFAAETSSPNVPEGSAVSITVEFGEGTATIRW